MNTRSLIASLSIILLSQGAMAQTFEYGNCSYTATSTNGQHLGTSELNEVQSIRYDFQKQMLTISIKTPRDMEASLFSPNYKFELQGQASSRIPSQGDVQVYELSAVRASKNMIEDYGQNLSIKAAIGVKGLSDDSITLVREVLSSLQKDPSKAELLKEFGVDSKSYVVPDWKITYDGLDSRRDNGGRGFRAGAVVYTCPRIN